MKKPQLAESQERWSTFAREASLTQEQLKYFQQYFLLLQAANKSINLTTIINEQDVIDYHFKDSLAIKDLIDMSTITHMVDVGTGGGFPGIALAIKYPHLAVTLIEVNSKKVQFLDVVITQLNLAKQVTIFEEDWRSFLRTTDDNIQLFCARASLQPEELIRVFKPSSPYKNAQLVYWAAEMWQPSKIVVPYVVKDISYMIRNKKRRLILLRQKAD